MMKYFDAHVHCFPDSIAGHAISQLAKSSNYVPETDGTFRDTVAKQTAWGAMGFTLLNIATTPKQEKKVNDFLIEHNGGPIVSFGSVHPASDRAIEELERCADAGLKGIKFHPEYQNHDLDDPSCMRLYEQAANRDMAILIHGGYDPAFPGSERCSPKRAAKVAETFRGATVIIAHLGGCLELAETFQYLGSTGAYLDISMVYMYIEGQETLKFIRAHGADKILFATDCPWSSPLKTIEYVESLGLKQEEKELIYYKNAKRLFNLKEELQ